MSPAEAAPGSPEDWLRRARSDLTIASRPPSSSILLEDLCFHTQQAAEKAFKAVLIASSLKIEKTHNLTRLLELLPQEMEIPQLVREAVILTDYAVMSRYPGDYEPIEDPELRRSIELAQAVVKWAEQQVKSLLEGEG